MTKYCELVTEPDKIKYYVKKAFHIATTGRPGPTWLDIPLNVQGACIDTDDLADYDESCADYREYEDTLPPKVSRELVMSVIDRVKSSKRPVLNAGNGIRIAGAEKVFESVRKEAEYPCCDRLGQYRFVCGR